MRLSSCLEANEARHVDIEQQDLWFQLDGLVERTLCIGNTSYDLEIGLSSQESPDRAANERVVVR